MVTPIVSQMSYFYGLAIKLGLMNSSDLLNPLYANKANKELSYLRFSYLEDDLYNEVRKRTYYIAKFRAEGPDKQHLMDLIALTGDDKEMFDPFYKRVTLEILELLTPFTRNMNPAYLDRAASGILQIKEGATFNAGDLGFLAVDGSAIRVFKLNAGQAAVIIPAGAFNSTNWTEQPKETYTDDKLILFVENYDWMNMNSVPTADAMIFESIVVGIMANWFMMVLPDEAKNYIPMYQSNLTQVVGALNSSSTWKRKYVY